jgi:hypothetical protein
LVEGWSYLGVSILTEVAKIGVKVCWKVGCFSPALPDTLFCAEHQDTCCRAECTEPRIEGTLDCSKHFIEAVLQRRLDLPDGAHAPKK